METMKSISKEGSTAETDENKQLESSVELKKTTSKE